MSSIARFEQIIDNTTRKKQIGYGVAQWSAIFSLAAQDKKQEHTDSNRCDQMNNWKILSIIAIAFLGCGDSKSPPPAPKPVIELPISEVQQNANRDFDSSWARILAGLAQRNIPVQLVNKEIGRIVTAWVPMNDFNCTKVSHDELPLRCRTQYIYAISPIGDTASSTSIRYMEVCQDQGEVIIVCPGSAAEKLLVELAEDLK